MPLSVLLLCALPASVITNKAGCGSDAGRPAWYDPLLRSADETNEHAAPAGHEPEKDTIFATLPTASLSCLKPDEPFDVCLYASTRSHARPSCSRSWSASRESDEMWSCASSSRSDVVGCAFSISASGTIAASSLIDIVVGTAAEVSAVNSVDDRPVPCPGPATKVLADAYADLVRGRNETYRAWNELAS